MTGREYSWERNPAADHQNSPVSNNQEVELLQETCLRLFFCHYTETINLGFKVV